MCAVHRYAHGFLLNRQLSGNACREGIVLCDVLAVARARHLVARDHVGALARVRLRSGDDSRKHVAAYEHVPGICRAAVGQRRAVIGLCLAVCRDDDLCGYGVYSQPAVFLRDRVIVRIGAAVEHIGEAVGAFAGVEPAARHAVCRALACGPAVAAYSDGVCACVRQRRAVVGLFKVSGSQRYFALLNRQLSGNACREGIVLCDVLAVARARHLVARDHVGALARVRLRSGDDSRKHVAAYEHVPGICRAAVGQRRAVIGLCLAVCRDDDLCGYGVYSQPAVFLRDRVIVRIGAAVEHIGEAVGAFAGVEPTARHAVSRALACSPAVARHGDGAVRQRRAVVLARL